MGSIPTIVLTGGPCGGKTTILSYLEQKLSDLGYAVITVGESASEFILSGLKPWDMASVNFQRQILKHTIEKENRYKETAKFINGDKKVILCDRGVADASAYTSSHSFDLMLGELGYDIVELRDKRYDAVIFLRSVAVDQPEIYTCLNNKARVETVEQAKKLDEKTLSAWTGHPHLRIIDNSTNLDSKKVKALKNVCRVLGIPEPLEIERKYLVKNFDISKLPRPFQQIHIVQYYLRNETAGEVERIRARGGDNGMVYYHTVKREIRPGVQTEIEKQISKIEYFDYLRRADMSFGKIDKARYCFVWQNQYFELDSFYNPEGLTLLEIELTEEHDEITIPDFLRDEVTDVTSDPQYSNYEIARRIAQAV